MIIRNKDDRDALIRYARNIRAEDCPLLVDIGPYKRNRSLEQNRRHWAMLDDIANYMASVMDGEWYSPACWHELFCQRFLGTQVIKICNVPGGNVTEFGHDEYKVARHRSSKLSVSEFRDLDEQIEAYMADAYGWTWDPKRQKHEST